MQCNYNLHGNIVWYREALIMKIWKEQVEQMEETKKELKQRHEYELIEMINEYRSKVLALTITKSEKVQQEVLEYIDKKEKKMWKVLYGDWEIK